MVIINLNISKKFVGSTVPYVYVTPVTGVFPPL